MQCGVLAVQVGGERISWFICRSVKMTIADSESDGGMRKVESRLSDIIGKQELSYWNSEFWIVMQESWGRVDTKVEGWEEEDELKIR